MIWDETRKALALAECNRWHGTPHRNRMAQVGVGVDCIQFVNEILIASNVIERQPLGAYDVNDGTHNPSQRLAAAIKFALDVESVPLDQCAFGDLAVFNTGRQSGHVGFCGDGCLWHSLADRCVTKSQLNLWRGSIQFLFRIKSLGLKNSPQLATKL